MLTSIIIPTFNHLEDCLKPCLTSIQAHTNLSNVEVIVVANGCTDGTKEYVQSLGHPFKLLNFPNPLGYTKATKYGILHAQGEYVVLLNNDCVLLDNTWLEQLRAPLEDPKVGITGPLKKIHAPTRSEFVLFFCVMFRRKIYEQIGGLDDVFNPGYGEDIDFCRRLTEAQYSVRQVPDDSLSAPQTFPLWHQESKTVHSVPDWNDIVARNERILSERYSRVKYSIIIPTYNHLDDCLKPCLESVLRNTKGDAEIIVVANGCTDRTVEYVKPLCRVLEYSEPLGYAGAVNKGIEAAQGEFIVLLGNDTVILNDNWLDLLVAPFADSRVGITGPQRQTHPETGIDFMVFFCVMIRKSAFDKIGPIDESFNPGYGEDIDYCKLIQDEGYRLVQVPQEGTEQYFPIWHKAGQTVRHVPDWDNIVIRNTKRLIGRYGRKPEISIVIATYNHFEDYLYPCLQSLIANTDLSRVEVIVVANGCTDGTQTYVEGLGDPFRMIWSDAPLGYAKANNIGIQAARGEYVLLLNNDTKILGRDWLDLLLAPMSNPKVGLTGPYLNLFGPTNHLWFAFFCTLIKKEVFERIGLLDEVFGVGSFEDIDFCIRAHLAGYDLAAASKDPLINGTSNERIIGEFPIFHVGGGTVLGIENWTDVTDVNFNILKKRYSTDEIDINYDLHCRENSDINEHLPTLKKYAQECGTITEMGVRWGNSTWAFLAARPRRYIGYDIIRHHEPIGILEKAAKTAGIRFEFIVADTTNVEIEETDFLFIDTLHHYDQLSRELKLHGNKTRKYIGLHDTWTFAHFGDLNNGDGPLEDRRGPRGSGLKRAISEFLIENPHWVIEEEWVNNNGLTILKRK